MARATAARSQLTRVRQRAIARRKPDRLVAAIVRSVLLWYGTPMICACLRFIQDVAQPLLLVNLALIGRSSDGCV